MNAHKRRSHQNYVLNEGNHGVITTTRGIANSALMVSGGCPRAALEFLSKHGALPSDPIMGDVIRLLEGQTMRATQ